jgi:flagellar hook-associated protein 1 FlgK
VNTLLSSGQTSSGLPGRPIFTYDVADPLNAARSLALDSAVSGSQLALATGGASPQANGTANALAGLFNSANAADWVGGVSVQSLYSSVAGRVGQELSSAREQASTSQSALTTASAARQRTSGVSLDESAIAITSLQRFYQASAKLVSILDTLTTTEINLIR